MIRTTHLRRALAGLSVAFALTLPAAAQAAPFHMLFERNTPAGAGSELFLATFSTLADLMDANAASSGFTQIDVNDNFDVAGFAAVRDGTGGGVVPEPSTLLLVALGLAASAARRNRVR